MRLNILSIAALLGILLLGACESGTSADNESEKAAEAGSDLIKPSGKDPVTLSRSAVYYGFEQRLQEVYSSEGSFYEGELSPDWAFLANSKGYFSSLQTDTTCPEGGKLLVSTDTLYDGHYSIGKNGTSIVLDYSNSYGLPVLDTGITSGTWKATSYSYRYYGENYDKKLDGSDTTVTVTLRNDSLIAQESWPYCFSHRYWKDGEEENDVTSYLDGCNSLSLAHKDGRTMTYSLESISLDGRTEIRRVTYQGKSCLQTLKDYNHPTEAECGESWANFQAAPSDDYYWDDHLAKYGDIFESCLDSIGVPEELVDRFLYYHD